MKYFDHINLPEQIVPAPGFPPMQQLVEGLKKVRQDAIDSHRPNYFLDKLLSRLNDSYLENKEKQTKLQQLMHKLSQKYGEENIDFPKLRDGLLTFFLAKSARDIIYAPPSQSEQASHEKILLEYQDFFCCKSKLTKRGYNTLIRGVYRSEVALYTSVSHARVIRLSWTNITSLYYLSEFDNSLPFQLLF